MPADQITLKRLLKDPIYRKWFSTKPAQGAQGRWRVWFKETPTSPWEEKEFPSWKKGFKFVQANINNFYDMALANPSHAYSPPVVIWKRTKNPKTEIITKHRRHYVPPVAEDADRMIDNHKHAWCPYCRRPTIFTYFRRHHSYYTRVNFLGKPYDTNSQERICLICGVRLVFIKKYK